MQLNKKVLLIVLVLGVLLPLVISFWGTPTILLKSNDQSRAVSYTRPEDDTLWPFEFPFQYVYQKGSPIPLVCNPVGSNNCIGSGAIRETTSIDWISAILDLIFWLGLAFGCSRYLVRSEPKA